MPLNPNCSQQSLDISMPAVALCFPPVTSVTAQIGLQIVRRDQVGEREARSRLHPALFPGHGGGRGWPPALISRSAMPLPSVGGHRSPVWGLGETMTTLEELLEWRGN